MLRRPHLELTRGLALSLVTGLALGIVPGRVNGETPDATVEAAPSVAPLPEGWANHFAEIRPDPAPKKLTNSRHYLISNEDLHTVFKPSLTGKGGVYVGLATDQNYTMAAWAESEMLVLIDFDQMVVDLHEVYGVIFKEARTPVAFLDLWQSRSQQKVEGLILDDAPNENIGERRVTAYRKGRRAVERQLNTLLGQYHANGVATFLEDQRQYNHLRTLWQQGKVIPFRADLNGPHAVSDLARALEAVNRKVSVLYLSNAEQYFKYGAAFRANMLALPMDADTLVLRTWHVGQVKYIYLVQAGSNFRLWLQDPRHSFVQSMFKPRWRERPGRLLTIAHTPKPPPKPKPPEDPRMRHKKEKAKKRRG
ncbi:MAG: hypothetical protein ACE366_02250 [Bradymonadia bacterium]